MTGRLVIAVMCLGAAACGTDDKQGTRAECAQGGPLTDCPDAERTSQGACWRLVDCGAISVASDNAKRYTSGRCVDSIDRLTDDRRRLVINCIAASTCDALRVANSPANPNPADMHCLRFGAL